MTRWLQTHWQAIVVYGLGLPLYLALRRSGIGDRLGR